MVGVMASGCSKVAPVMALESLTRGRLSRAEWEEPISKDFDN